MLIALWAAPALPLPLTEIEATLDLSEVPSLYRGTTTGCGAEGAFSPR